MNKNVWSIDYKDRFKQFIERRGSCSFHLLFSELRNRLREDTQVLVRTIRSSIDLLQQARSASATPALGYV